MFDKDISSSISVEDLELIIPKGPYCYSGSRNPSDKNYKPCPFWDLLGERDGYCTLLGRGDKSEESTLCLWDQVKECSINCDYDKYLETKEVTHIDLAEDKDEA